MQNDEAVYMFYSSILITTCNTRASNTLISQSFQSFTWFNKIILSLFLLLYTLVILVKNSD